MGKQVVDNTAVGLDKVDFVNFPHKRRFFNAEIWSVIGLDVGWVMVVPVFMAGRKYVDLRLLSYVGKADLSRNFVGSIIALPECWNLKSTYLCLHHWEEYCFSDQDWKEL